MSDKLPAISCDLCVDPGMCCRSFPLNHYFSVGTTLKAIKEFLVKQNLSMFIPLRRNHVWRDDKGWQESWYFRCTKLQSNGRCGIYDIRPDLCRTYEPGTDMMCVHMRGMDGKPIIPQLKRK